jgi:hypothetical protein
MINALPLIAGTLAAMMANPTIVTMFKASERPIIVSRDTSKCLEVDQATSAIVLRECGPGQAQTMRFLNSRPGAGLMSGWKIYESGPIAVGIACLTGEATIGARLSARPCEGSPAQYWTFSSTDPGLRYVLRNGQGLCMGAASASDGAAVVMVDCQRGPTRTWNVTSTESVAYARNTPEREAAEAQQRAKVNADEARWTLLWAKPAASVAEQRELEQLAIYLDRVTLSARYDAYRARYEMRDYGMLNRFCERGYEFACAKIGGGAVVTNRATGSSGSYSNNAAPPSATVQVRTYDQYGNYTGSSTMSRTEAELRGAR